MGYLKGMTINGMEFSIEGNGKLIGYVFPVHLSKTDADVYCYMSILTNGPITCKSEFIDRRWISATVEFEIRNYTPRGRHVTC